MGSKLSMDMKTIDMKMVMKIRKHIPLYLIKKEFHSSSHTLLFSKLHLSYGMLFGPALMGKKPCWLLRESA